jgi:hypothetical protein
VRSAGKLPAGFRASPSLRAEVPRPCCPQSLSISIERLTVECRRPRGIHRIRLDPLYRAGPSGGAEEPELSRRNPLPSGRVNLRIACPGPSTSATIQATAGLMRNALHPVVSSFPPLLPRWTVITRARSGKNGPDPDTFLAAAAYYSPPADLSVRHVAAPEKCEHKRRLHVLDDHRCITDDEEHPHVPGRRGETAGRRVAQACPRHGVRDAAPPTVASSRRSGGGPGR